ncbi:hypothetical protein D3C81_762140 [compost metagenome]
MTDWLDKRAEQERNRRLYGKEPSDTKRPLIQALEDLLIFTLKLVGWLILIAVLGFLALTGLVKLSRDMYVLECQGTVSSDYAESANAKLFLEVTEYGGIIRLWNKDFGTAEAEIPRSSVNHFQMKNFGTHIRLVGIGNKIGSYSPLSRHVQAPMLDGSTFEGECKVRDH